MKGFKSVPKNFAFPTSADSQMKSTVGAVSTPREQQMVRGHFRTKPSTPRGSRFAEGGMVGNAVVKRTSPVTQFDKEYGGKGPLRSGFASGGTCKAAAKAAVAKHVATPAPKGHKGMPTPGGKRK